MAEQLQLRRGSATNVAAFTPQQGECVVDTTNNRLCVGDGSTAGGWAAAKLSEAMLIVKVDLAPVTGFSQTIANGCTLLLLKPAGTLATGTVVMPAAPADGAIARVVSSQTVTALTVSPSAGQSVVGAPSTVGPAAPFAMVYDAASATWYLMT